MGPTGLLPWLWRLGCFWEGLRVEDLGFRGLTRPGTLISGS